MWRPGAPTAGIVTVRFPTVKAASETDIGIVIVDHHNVCVKVPSCSRETNCDFRTNWALVRRYRCITLYVECCIAVPSQIANRNEIISFKNCMEPSS